jgi:hypothetical protein
MGSALLRFENWRKILFRRLNINVLFSVTHPCPKTNFLFFNQGQIEASSLPARLPAEVSRPDLFSVRDRIPACRQAGPGPFSLRDLTPNPFSLQDLTPNPFSLRDLTPNPFSLRDLTPACRFTCRGKQAPTSSPCETSPPTPLHGVERGALMVQAFASLRATACAFLLFGRRLSLDPGTGRPPSPEYPCGKYPFPSVSLL